MSKTNINLTRTHEGGVRIPFFVYWKGTIVPAESNHITALYDFLATTADLANIIPQNTDGMSWVPTLLGDHELQKRDEHFYWEKGISASDQEQSVRLDNWWAYRTHPTGMIRLFDLRDDIQCEKDLAKTYPVIVKQVLDIMAKEHIDSEWYINPGEIEEQIKAKNQLAIETGSLQNPTRANSTYSQEKPK